MAISCMFLDRYEQLVISHKVKQESTPVHARCLWGVLLPSTAQYDPSPDNHPRVPWNPGTSQQIPAGATEIQKLQDKCIIL